MRHEILGILVIALAAMVGAVPVREYRIETAPGASAAEMTAASELSVFLGRITGTPLPGGASGGPAIHVGQSPEALKAFGLSSWQELKPDEVLLKRSGEEIYVAGDRPRGTLYAAYELLERCFGVRFWTAKVTEVPSNPGAEFPAQLNYRYAPAFAMRSAGYDLGGQWAVERNDIFAARSRNNGQLYELIDDAWGGGIDLVGQVHTFTLCAPMFGKEDMAAHPEWFSLVNGQRCLDLGQTQPCYSNEELRKAWAARAIARWKGAKHPGYIALDQNDGGEMCQCPQCTAFVKAHGNYSDLMLDAMNQIGALVRKECPDAMIETLAYNRTEASPKSVRPAGYVAPRLCPIYQRIFRPMEAPVNESYRKTIQEWAAQADHLLIWSYIANYWKYYLPLPNWRVIGADLRFYRRLGVESIFEQGSYNGCGSLADLGDLRTWLVSRLLWNPDLDTDALIDEFTQGYYREAAPYVRRYIDLMLQSLDRHPEAGGFAGMNSTTDWLDTDILVAAYRCMSEALQHFGSDPVLGDRVLFAAAPIYFALVERLPMMAAPPADAETLLTVLDAAIQRSGVKLLGESLTTERWHADLQNLLSFAQQNPNDGPQPPVANGRPGGFWWDFEKHDTIVHMPATHCKLVDDPASWDGHASVFPATNVEWMLERRRLPFGKYDIWVEARVEGVDSRRPPQGDAFSGGIYSFGSNQSIGKNFRAEEFVGKQYRLAYLGSYDFAGSQCVWVCPAVNPTVDRVYIDRLILLPAQNRP